MELSYGTVLKVRALLSWSFKVLLNNFTTLCIFTRKVYTGKVIHIVTSKHLIFQISYFIHPCSIYLFTQTHFDTWLIPITIY